MDFDLMISSFPKLLNATLITLKLVSLSLVFGIFLGTFFAILRTGKNKFLKNFSYYYSYIFRGTPMLVQLFTVFKTQYLVLVLTIGTVLAYAFMYNILVVF